MKKLAKGISNLCIRYFWWIGGLAMLVSYGLAMWAANGQSVWFDEGYSILLAQRPVHELLFLTSVDAHPPTYYLLLKAWGELFGWSEFALRSLSAVFGALTVGAALLLVRTIFTKRIALAVLPFVTFAPFLVRYDYEIRMYALVSLIGVLATWALVKAYRSGESKWWVAYGALVALGMYTLYMSAAIWLAHAIWLLVVTLRAKKPPFRQKWFYSYLMAVAIFIPYLPTTIDQFMDSALPDIGKPMTFDMLTNILGTVVSYTPSWQIDAWLTLGLLGLIMLSLWLAHGIWHQADRSRRLMLSLLLSLIGVPLGFFALTSLPPLHPIFIIRYEAHVAVYIYLWIGLMVALGWHYGKRRLSTVTGVLALFLLVSGLFTLQQTGNVNYERMQLPEGKAVRQAVTCTNDTTIVADDPYTYIDGFYYFTGCNLRFYSSTEVEPLRGYAPLSGQPTRIASPNEVNTNKLVHLYWTTAAMTFNVDTTKYRLVSSQTFDQQVVDTYVRR